MKRIGNLCLGGAVLLTALYSPSPVEAQQLEPRRWSHLPTGAQFIGAGYVRTDGDILFDPALQVEDATIEMNSVGVGYVRSIEAWNRSARVDFDVTYFDTRWAGLLEGAPAARDVSGFGDPRIRFSMLLVGAPALGRDEFQRYQAENPVNTIVGAGLSVRLPIGQYDESKLLNLGSNRFAVRPELGVVHIRRKWSFELTGSISLYQDNDEFWPGDSNREQDPLALLQGHVIHTFRPGLWTSLSGGYGFGGGSEIDGVGKEDKQDNFFWAVTLGIPLSRTQGIKLAYAGVRTDNLVGSDSENYVVTWSLLF